MPVTPGDPWARRDAWRYKGIFSTWERYRPKHTLPGVGLGAAVFGVYVVFDMLFSRRSHGHETSHEGSSH